MRWFVEISPLGQSTVSGSYCIEATQWRAALQYARQLRNDQGSLSKFFVELLSDGCRAIDPDKRLRYVVRQAADDAPLHPSDAIAAPISSLPPPVPDSLLSSQFPRPSSPLFIPSFQVLLVREEEPCDEVPITYREYAFLVEPGIGLAAAEALLWSRFGEIVRTLEAKPSGQFIQLAVFDHEFEGRPLRSPLATLIWKDWRGDPVVQFPSEPGRMSVRHWPELTLEESSLPPPKGAGVVVQTISQPPLARHSNEPDQPSIVVAPDADDTVPSAWARTSERVPYRAAPRRSKGEDLVSELCDVMHELHYAADVISGAEFVSDLVSRVLPADFVLIHLFDNNTRHFVVIRATGRDARNVIMYRTSDRDPLLERAMHRLGAVHVPEASNDERFRGGRWKVLNVTPHAVLCGGVKQGGRYLGAIEVVNPSGGEPFQENEVNALAYICEQFGEFLGPRPIVIDADVVYARY